MQEAKKKFKLKDEVHLTERQQLAADARRGVLQ